VASFDGLRPLLVASHCALYSLANKLRSFVRSEQCYGQNGIVTASSQNYCRKCHTKNLQHGTSTCTLREKCATLVFNYNSAISQVIAATFVPMECVRLNILFATSTENGQGPGIAFQKSYYEI